MGGSARRRLLGLHELRTHQITHRIAEEDSVGAQEIS